jgi:hypothetical protein
MKKYFFINLIIFTLTILLVSGASFILSKNVDTTFAQSTATDPAKDTTPPKLSDIVISDISATSTVIVWKTDKLSDSLINYGLDKNYGISRDPRFDKTEHKIILDNLLPGMEYFFRITSADSSGNQGISSDYSFTTPETAVKPEANSQETTQNGNGSSQFQGAQAENGSSQTKGDKAENGIAPNQGAKAQNGLTVQELQQVLQFIQNTTDQQQLEQIITEAKNVAQIIDKPPTIILDLANVEVGTDYAVVSWETDKESNSIVALAKEGDYRPDADNPYTWKQGEPNEQIINHSIRITGLLPATIYHFQVSSEDSMGLTGKSTDKSFKTKSILPEIANVQIVKIEETAATIKFTTNVPCTSILDYTNLSNNVTKLEGDSAYVTIHSIVLSNLLFDTYYSVVIRVESIDGESAQSQPMTFITTKDVLPPSVSKVNTESTLYPGSENKIQTIISFATDEAAKCQLFYHQGLTGGGEPGVLPNEDDFTLKHVQVVTNFLPASVYKFWLDCKDPAENSGKSEDFIMLTPTREESIIDIILKNFESSFGWVKNMGGKQ